MVMVTGLQALKVIRANKDHKETLAEILDQKAQLVQMVLLD
jgi:hypothetical protein